MSFDSFRGFWRGSLIQREIFLSLFYVLLIPCRSQGRFNLYLLFSRSESLFFFFSFSFFLLEQDAGQGPDR